MKYIAGSLVIFFATLLAAGLIALGQPGSEGIVPWPWLAALGLR